jgi:hypothetical protein
MAAIFNLSLIRTSGSVRGSLIVLPDLKNMSMAVGLPMLSCTQADINVSSYQLPVNSRHLGFPTVFDLTVTRMSKSVHTSLIVLLDPENVGVAVGISLLSNTQAEIKDLAYILPVNSGHLGFTSQPDVVEYTQ